ncbi:MAG TPA: carcinine hydrolase/isopenicillin-N N-acyltransferase family protein [Abditibacteriaceae bacterium]|jgi:hypothetical protein
MGHPIYLLGQPDEVGAILGRCQQRVLAERVARTLRRAGETGTTDLLHERAERFARVLAQAAPHWLNEAQAQASAAGIEAWQLLALNCPPRDFWGKHYIPAPLDDAGLTAELVDAYEAQGVDPGLGGECTAYFALGEATVSGETLFHKNREERDEVQCVYIKGIQGKFRFVGGGDIGNIGTAHLQTENLWAGANNTGSDVPPEEYVDCALSDSHALRYLAEKCRTLDDIIPAVEHLIARSWLGGGGYNKGSIFLFADAERGLVVEATSRRLAFEWFRDDAQAVRTNHFVLPALSEYSLPPHPGSMQRLERATQLWEAQHGLAGLSLAREIGRDRENAPHAICRNPSDSLGSVTVSTSSATISKHDDNRCQTHFHNGHPRYVPVVVHTPVDRVSDSDLVSGAHNQLSRNYRAFV